MIALIPGTSQLVGNSLNVLLFKFYIAACQTDYTWPADAPLPIPVAAIYELTENGDVSPESDQFVPKFVFESEESDDEEDIDLHSRLRESANLNSISNISAISTMSQRDINALARLCEEISLEITQRSRDKLQELACVAADIAQQLGPDAYIKAEKLRLVCEQLSSEID